MLSECRVPTTGRSTVTTPFPTGFDAARALQLARQTFEIEAQALLGLAARQGDGFAGAVAAMLACRGRVIVMGMGKSGHVGRKIAATLASTGTPAFFVHPAEASHGDLRRQVERGADLRTLSAGAVMHPHPRTIRDDALAVAAAELMELHRITSVAVLDANGALAGLLSIGDLMRAKVV